MVTEEKLKQNKTMPHSVILDNREKLTLTGVADVDSFDEQTIILRTSMGELTVRGERLHISRLNTETGELEASGKIHAFVYMSDARNNTGFFSRLFR